MKIFAAMLGRALLLSLAALFVSFFISCGILETRFEREAPHDGQNGLAAAFLSFYVAAGVGLLVLIISFFYNYLRKINKLDL